MNPQILHVSENISKLSISVFAGAATYCSLVEHPARLSCGSNLAITQFLPSYRRAAYMQASLASVASISSVIAYLGDNDSKWLVAGILMFSILPYTFAVMMPINKKLLDSKIDRNSKEAKSLLERWGCRHWFRTISSLIALVVSLHTN